MNQLTLNYIDVDGCKAIIQQAKERGETSAILVPSYSTNIQSRYMDGEQLQYDLAELETELRCTLTVTDYDDLTAEW